MSLRTSNPQKKLRSDTPRLIWKKYCTDESEVEYIQGILNDNTFGKIFSEILKDLLESEEKAESSLTQYESPSWSYLQADRNGSKRTIRRLKSILNL